jgi:hypothetical protein
VREQAVPPAQRRPELAIPAELDALVMACMAKRAAERPQSARELAARLEAIAVAPARPSRLPRQVAASPTVDLTDRASELADLVATSDLTPARSRTPRLILLVLLLLGLAGAAIAIVLAARGGGDEPGSSAAEAAPDAGRPAPPAAHDAGASAAAVDAGVPDAGGTRPKPARDLAREKARAHLEAAARARRAGQTLKEIASLDAALAAEPGNREAAYRLGDALLRSGDKPRACKYLRRAKSLAAARKRAAEAGCTD